jgi:hypothetical protein
MFFQNPTTTTTVLFFQVDGSPGHFAHIIHDCLNVNFPGRWIGGGGG